MLLRAYIEERLILSAGGFIRLPAILPFYNVVQLHHTICKQIVICSVSFQITITHFICKQDWLQTTSCFYEVGP